MKLQKFEIKVGDEWCPVRGTIIGLKEGWLHWQDSDGSSGLSRPGTWRSVKGKTKKEKNE